MLEALSESIDLTDAAFVGREAEMQRLRARFQEAAAGRGGAVFLHAESGGGKSRLLQEFTRDLSARIFWGQAVERSGAAPLRALEGIVLGIIRQCASEPGFAAHLRERAGERADALLTVFPDLQPVFPAAERMTTERSESSLEERTVRALTLILEALGTPGTPAVVILDDCQWADGLSMRVVAQCQKRAAQSGGHLLLIPAYRTNELPPDSPLHGIQPLERIALGAVGAASIRRAVESMVGAVSDRALTLVRKLSSDNMFMVTAVVRGLIETRVLSRELGVWDIDGSANEEQRTSVDAGAFLRRRVQLLPHSTVELLKIGAVHGKQFELSLLGAVSGEATEAVRAALDEALRRHILVGGDGADEYAFAHDRLRETTLDLISADEKVVMHRALGDHLASKGDEHRFAIAYHYAAAGDLKRALPYALAAAEEAYARHALETALVQYRLAKRASADADVAVRLRISRGLGNVLVGRGLWDEAAPELEEARALAPTDLEKAEIDSEITRLCVYLGDTARAIGAAERGLLLLGVRPPKTNLGSVAGLFRQAALQTLHSLFPRTFRRHRSLGEIAPTLVMSQLFELYNYSLYFQCRLIEALRFQLEQQNRLEKFPDTGHLAIAHSAHAVVCAAIPWFSRGTAYGRSAVEIRKTLGETEEWGFGNAWHFYGVVLLAASRFDEALDALLRALVIFERLGYRWDEDQVRCNLGYVFYRTGNLPEAVAACRRTFEDGMPARDVQAVTPALSAWAKATGGAVPEEVLSAAEAERGRFDLQTAVEMQQARAIWHLNRREVEPAIELLREAKKDFESKGVQQEYLVGALPWLATAERMRIEQRRGAASSSEWRSAREAARRAFRVGRRFRNNLPHALRELGLLALLAGDSRSARRYLDEALTVASGQGARYEAAQTLLARGRAAERFGWQDLASDLPTARAELVALGANMQFHDLA